MLEGGHHVVSLDRRMPDWSHARLEPIEVDLFDARRRPMPQGRGRPGMPYHMSSITRHHPANLIEQATAEDIRRLANSISVPR